MACYSSFEVFILPRIQKDVLFCILASPPVAK